MDELTRDKAHEIAVRMLHREHDRWNQNTLFFFGVLVAVFSLRQYFQDLVPASLALSIASVVSLMTLGVALAIRNSTDAWRDTIRCIEKSTEAPDFQPFAIFQYHVDQHGWRWYVRDLLLTLCLIPLFWPAIGIGRKAGYFRDDHFLSVTRLVSLLALIATIFFAVLAYRAAPVRIVCHVERVPSVNSSPTPTP